MNRALHCDILIAGGGLGGCAAALAAASLGYRVIMVEKNRWIGGQLTAQAVPADEHPWIEQCGCTARYRRLRTLIRQYYRDHYPLTPEARQDPNLNPGRGGVSRICCEPRIAHAALEQMLSFDVCRGQLQILRGYRPIEAEVVADTVRQVTFRSVDGTASVSVEAPMVLDATELGDLLPLTGAEYVSGAESRQDTGELHAVAGPARPGNVQAFTWCFAMGYDPDGRRIIDRPASYEHWQRDVPRMKPEWPGSLLSWTYSYPLTCAAVTRMLFGAKEDDPSFWRYRRLVARANYPAEHPIHEVTLVNWPQNDFLEGNLIDQPPALVERYRQAARELSLSLLYWMQTEAPRHDGGTGYPGLYLRPDMTGTEDGLAMDAYIRESRRIRAQFTVLEEHVGKEARPGAGAAAHFEDSVGIGYYRIDLHPDCGGVNYIDIESFPFQIPLGALVPVRLRNLLPACKNIGTTHITNGCYRLHPVEWNIGEAAGLLAAFCLERRTVPVAVHAKVALRQEFQALLHRQAIEFEWPRGTT